MFTLWGSTTDLQGYVDLDLTGDIDTTWSTIGYVFIVGGAEVSVVMWIIIRLRGLFGVISL